MRDLREAVVPFPASSSSSSSLVARSPPRQPRSRCAASLTVCGVLCSASVCSCSAPRRTWARLELPRRPPRPPTSPTSRSVRPSLPAGCVCAVTDSGTSHYPPTPAPPLPAVALTPSSSHRPAPSSTRRCHAQADALHLQVAQRRQALDALRCVRPSSSRGCLLAEAPLEPPARRWSPRRRRQGVRLVPQARPALRLHWCVALSVPLCSAESRKQLLTLPPRRPLLFPPFPSCRLLRLSFFLLCAVGRLSRLRLDAPDPASSSSLSQKSIASRQLSSCAGPTERCGAAAIRLAVGRHSNITFNFSSRPGLAVSVAARAREQQDSSAAARRRRGDEILVAEPPLYVFLQLTGMVRGRAGCMFARARALACSRSRERWSRRRGWLEPADDALLLLRQRSVYLLSHLTR